MPMIQKKPYIEKVRDRLAGAYYKGIRCIWPDPAVDWKGRYPQCTRDRCGTGHQIHFVGAPLSDQPRGKRLHWAWRRAEPLDPPAGQPGFPHPCARRCHRWTAHSGGWVGRRIHPGTAAGKFKRTVCPAGARGKHDQSRHPRRRSDYRPPDPHRWKWRNRRRADWWWGNGQAVL